MNSKIGLVSTIGAAVILGGCFEHHNNREGAGKFGSTANAEPTISGSPQAFVLEGEAYEFTPTASDADGDTLEFKISRKPGWATFDKSTGRLAGTPQANDVGNFTNVLISVSDGRAAAQLPDFDITVNQIAFGSVTLAWTPPTENNDGTPLTDLAGYRIHYGLNEDLLSQSVALDNPGLTRYVIENLSPARWYFSMTSVNSKGVESKRSPTASKTIS